MRYHTHSQEQHSAEHRQTDWSEYSGEDAQRTATGRLANIAEFDVPIFGRFFGGAGVRVAEHSREVIDDLTTAVHQWYFFAVIAGERDAVGRGDSGTHLSVRFYDRSGYRTITHCFETAAVKSKTNRNYL